MSDFLDALVTRSMGTLPTLMPRRMSRFEAEAILPADDLQDEVDTRDARPTARYAPNPRRSGQIDGMEEATLAASRDDMPAPAPPSGMEASSVTGVRSEAPDAIEGEEIVTSARGGDAIEGPGARPDDTIDGPVMRAPSKRDRDAGIAETETVAMPSHRVDSTTRQLPDNAPREGSGPVATRGVSSPGDAGHDVQDVNFTEIGHTAEADAGGRHRAHGSPSAFEQTHPSRTVDTGDQGTQRLAGAGASARDSGENVAVRDHEPGGHTGEIEAPASVPSSRRDATDRARVQIRVSDSDLDPGASRWSAAKEPPARISVSIGRIEVRAAERPEPAPIAQQSVVVRQPRVSLGEYLARSRGGRR